jgi:hypothetical protein
LLRARRGRGRAPRRLPAAPRRPRRAPPARGGGGPPEGRLPAR